MQMTVNIDRYIEDMEQWKKTREENERLQQELQRKDNNWNELKKYVMNCYIVGHTVQNGTINQILDKIKELEESNENRKCS